MSLIREANPLRRICWRWTILLATTYLAFGCDRKIEEAGMESVTSVCFSPDGKTLVACGGKYNILRGGPGWVYLWDADKWQEKAKIVEGFTDRVWCMAVSPDGKLLVTGGAKCEKPKAEENLSDPGPGNPLLAGELRLWSLPTRELIAEWRLGRTTMPNLVDRRTTIQNLAFSPDNKKIAVVGTGSSYFGIWNAATKQEELEFTGFSPDIRCVAWSPNGKVVASGLAGRKDKPGPDEKPRGACVILWDPATGKQDNRLDHPDFVSWLSYMPNGKKIVTYCDDGIVRWWDASTCKQLSAWPKQKNELFCLALSRDAKRMATGSKGEVLIWDVATGKVIQTLKGMASGVTSVAFSPDGKLVAAGFGLIHEAGAVYVWELESGKTVFSVK